VSGLRKGFLQESVANSRHTGAELLTVFSLHFAIEVYNELAPMYKFFQKVYCS
jgi:hypothetical protein